jgi:hypothetical protein
LNKKPGCQVAFPKFRSNYDELANGGISKYIFASAKASTVNYILKVQKTIHVEH